ncbi:uracil-DNA glycosylase [Candidatus Bathyarchaeota archaeon]|nr:uracil-DNA glycosylase [Candidatus Bathyarchaeota archaeon]
MYHSTDEAKTTRMDALRDRAQSCTRCDLWESRTNAVVGSGSLDAEIVLVGEAPGRTEDESGLPFVGRAGKLLDDILGKAGLSRDDVFVMNVVKCRPPDNRRPKKVEMRSCEPYLVEQLEIIEPKIIAPMGNSPLSYFFRRYGLGRAVIGDVHGEEYRVDATWGRVTLFPLYHPAATIYNRGLTEMLEEDMKRLAGLKGS